MSIVQCVKRHESHASSSSSADKWTPKPKKAKPKKEENSEKISRPFPTKLVISEVKSTEEKKATSTSLTVTFKPDVIEKTQENNKLKYLDEACKNLIYIRKITSVEYGENLSQEVKYYALLYHIFRCFETLKRYQECGGSKQKFNQDEVANLRLMIMHRGGALAADEASVFEFADTLKVELTTTLLSLIQKNQMKSELTEEQRKEIFVEFGLMDNNVGLKLRGVHHIALEIQQTPLYVNLKKFHEVGILKHKYNDQQLVERKYLPLINTILPTLNKVSWSDENTFLPAYMIHIQALRMLVTICGEFGNFRNHKLNGFLKYCHEQRVLVGHNIVDLKNPVQFLRDLAGKVVLWFLMLISGCLRRLWPRWRLTIMRIARVPRPITPVKVQL